MYLVKVSSTTSRDMSCACKFVLIWVDIQLECEVLLRKVRRMGEGLRKLTAHSWCDAIRVKTLD